jgi:hypothetical protein
MALSEDYDGKTNEYLHMFNPKRMDPKVYEAAEGAKLWTATMNLLQTLDAESGAYL